MFHFAFCFPSACPWAFLWSCSRSSDPLLGSWTRGKWAEIILPEHWLWVVAKAVLRAAPVAFILLRLGLVIPLIMLLWPPTGKKKSLARLFPQETFQVSNELGQISPLECAALGLASLRIPWTFPLTLKHCLIWTSNLTPEEKQIPREIRFNWHKSWQAVSPPPPPFSFSIFREKACESVIRCSEFWKVQLWKANPSKETVYEKLQVVWTHKPHCSFLPKEWNDSISLKRNC